MQISSVDADLISPGKEKNVIKSESSVTHKCYDRRGKTRTSLDIWLDQQLPYDCSNLRETTQTFQTVAGERPMAV